jgi:hypothetical protein
MLRGPNYPPPPLPVFSRARVQLPIPNYPPPPLPGFPRAKARIPDVDYWLNALSDPRLAAFRHSYITPEMTNLYWYKRLNDMYKIFTRNRGAEQSLPAYDMTQDYKKVSDFIREELAFLNSEIRIERTDRLKDFLYWGTNYIRFPTLQSIVSEVWLYIDPYLDQVDVENNYYESIFFKVTYNTPDLLAVPLRYLRQTISANRLKIYYVEEHSTLENDISNGLLISNTNNFQGTIMRLVGEIRRAMTQIQQMPGGFLARLVDGELIVVVKNLEAGF